LRQSLEAVLALDQEFIACAPEEEDNLRCRLGNLLNDMGFKNPLALINIVLEKKIVAGELGPQEQKLAAITQPIAAELEVEECRDGSLMTVQCWDDELLIRGVGREIRIERPASEALLATLGRSEQRIMISFNYEREELEVEIGAT